MMRGYSESAEDRWEAEQFRWSRFADRPENEEDEPEPEPAPTQPETQQ